METNLSLPTPRARTALTGRSIMVLAAATLLVLLGARGSPEEHASATSTRSVAEHRETPRPAEETTQVARADRAPQSRIRLIM